ncbi:unnamed protein product [Vitrella brassicaformis CCMP3155]|uniref:RNA-binding S4 domain-containing protein n=1 Tax=Vitrella brassicaformis (strain CCMP3155) TaxID=1169540 RepID=A0A0G4F1R6_VITBC|nr:unnamed protein product [Vitrella brassicaformis CCMP3155]|eukprot:CEM05541.1 unnamed protein product [Vitrella brassicaformis CCMP3155]
MRAGHSLGTMPSLLVHATLLWMWIFNAFSVMLSRCRQPLFIPPSHVVSPRRSFVRSLLFGRTHRGSMPRPPPASREALVYKDVDLDALIAQWEANGVGDDLEDESLPDESRDLSAEQVHTLAVEASDAGVRLDRFLSDHFPRFSRSYLGQLCQDQKVFVDGRPARKSAKVEEGQTVTVELGGTTEPSSNELLPDEWTLTAEPIPLSILYEDDSLVVINKQADLIVHPAPGSWNGTVINALMHHFHLSLPPLFESAESAVIDSAELLPLRFRPGVVHRLDKGSTGVLVVAKTKQAQAHLSQQFADRLVNKTYVAVSVGNPGTQSIDVPIARHPTQRHKMTAVRDPSLREPVSKSSSPVTIVGQSPRVEALLRVARPAESEVRTIATDGRLSVVEVDIRTGRTHQIRVHLQHIGCPVLGDETYGNADWNRRLARALDRQNLKRRGKRGQRAGTIGGIFDEQDGPRTFFGVDDIPPHLRDDGGEAEAVGDETAEADGSEVSPSSGEWHVHPLLHAQRLELTHPMSGEAMRFEAPLPDDLRWVAGKISPRLAGQTSE